MNVLFMGTPDFAVPSLNRLVNSEHNIIGVFTQPDKPKGRGHKMQFSDVKEAAINAGINAIYQPDTLKTDDVYKQILDLNPDIIIVVAYGKILPKRILDIPKYGCVNVHGSILPKYRGAAPIQWSVLNGDKIAGVTTMFMGPGLDTGDILLISETEVGINETSGELFDRLSELGADLLIKTIESIEKKCINPVPQDETLATYAPMVGKDLSPIDWSKSNFEIHNQIRGLNPWPGAYTTINGRKLKVHASLLADGDGEPGTFYSTKGKLLVFCGSGSLELVEVQPENGKRMNGNAYLVGHPITK